MRDKIFDLLSKLESYVSDAELTRDVAEMLTQEFEFNDPSPERAKDVYVRSDKLARVIHDRLYRETETVTGIFSELWETLVKKKPTEGDVKNLPPPRSRLCAAELPSEEP